MRHGFIAAGSGLAALLVLAACSPSDTPPPTGPELAQASLPLSVTPSTLAVTWPLARPTFVATVAFATILTATSSDAACATVSPASATPDGPPSRPKTTTFTVTPVHEGSCTITVRDKKNNSAQVSVTVAYPSMVFTSEQSSGSVNALFSMKADGTGLKQLTFNPERDFRAEFSRDGSRLAFTSDRDGPTPPLNFEVYSMNADGSDQVRLTNAPGFDDDPTWSPDGTKIAFDGRQEGEPEKSIYVMEANGSNVARLTTEQAQEPAWSPDGTKIAFAASRNHTGILIWVMNADGTDEHPLTTPNALTNQGDLAPAWSPDGSKVAFASRRGGTGGLSIYSVNADGTGLTEITHRGVLDTSPSWSPDGSGLAYSALSKANSSEIWIVNADGSLPTQLTDNPGLDGDPAWKP